MRSSWEEDSEKSDLSVGKKRLSVRDRPRILQSEILRVKGERGCFRLSGSGVGSWDVTPPSLWVGLGPTCQV